MSGKTKMDENVVLRRSERLKAKKENAEKEKEKVFKELLAKVGAKNKRRRKRKQSKRKVWKNVKNPSTKRNISNTPYNKEKLIEKIEGIIHYDGLEYVKVKWRNSKKSAYIAVSDLKREDLCLVSNYYKELCAKFGEVHPSKDNNSCDGSSLSKQVVKAEILDRSELWQLGLSLGYEVAYVKVEPVEKNS